MFYSFTNQGFFTNVVSSELFQDKLLALDRTIIAELLRPIPERGIGSRRSNHWVWLLVDECGP